MKKGTTMATPPTEASGINLIQGFNFKIFLLMVWSILLTGLTFFLGGVPMRSLRKLLGSASFWGMQGLLCVGLFLIGWSPLALAMAVLTILIGVYAELEQRSVPLFYCGFGATLSAVFISGVIFLQWSFQFTKSWTLVAEEYLKQQIVWLESIKVIDGTKANLDIGGLVNQLPSMFLVVVLITLALSLVFDGRMKAWIEVPVVRKEKLSAFRLPDFFVWFLIGSLFGSFFNHGSEILNAISANLLNVTLLLYFFQGLAIANKYFDYFKIKLFWRCIWMVLFINQMFVVVSFIGFLDFWFNFRERLVAKASETVN